jgi:hypothetical protein
MVLIFFDLEFITLAAVEKKTDLRPFLESVKALEPNDFVTSWQKYKQQRKDEEKNNIPVSDSKHVETWSSYIAKQTTNVLQGIVGGVGIGAKRPALGRAATLLEKVEIGTEQIRKSIHKEYLNFLERERKMIKDNQAMIKKQMEELENTEFKLIDYLTGNVPQLGEELHKK